MLIEIYTQSKPFQNGFAYARQEIIDGIKQGVVKDFELCSTQLQADLLNIGLAMKDIVKFDNQFGIEIKTGFKKKESDKDYKTIQTKESYRIYSETLERCDVIIYTENVEVFENLKYSMRFYENKLIRKMLYRIVELQKLTLVKISMPKQILQTWQLGGVKKYA